MSDPRQMRRFMERLNALPIPQPLSPEQWSQPGAKEEAGNRADKAGQVIDAFLAKETGKSWSYHSAHELEGKTLHLWVRDHQDGYKAYALTHQPNNNQPFVKPSGTGHYAGTAGLLSRTGIRIAE